MGERGLMINTTSWIICIVIIVFLIYLAIRKQKGVNLLKQELKKKVEEWWEDLDYPIKVELIEVVYPDFYPDVDEGWHYLDWEVKLELYEENNPGVKETINKL